MVYIVNGPVPHPLYCATLPPPVSASIAVAKYLCAKYNLANVTWITICARGVWHPEMCISGARGVWHTEMCISGAMAHLFLCIHITWP